MRWFHAVKVGCCLAVAALLSLTWFTSLPNEASPPVDLGVEDLYIRLLEAETAAQNVSRELGRVLEQLQLAHDQNLTDTLPGPRTQSHNLTQPGNHSLTQPGNQTAAGSSNNTSTLSVVGGARLQIHAHFYLPHLSLNEDSLTPNVVLGGARTGVSMVLGVPTVRREKQNYLINTLSSLLYNLTPLQQRDMLIVICVAETDSLYVSSVADTLSKNFPREVLSGLLEVVSPSPHFYPNLTNLPETFGDSKDRVKWRTKQNLDYSFLMLYVQNKGLYYVQLEDDIVAKADYFSTMMNYVTQHASGPWLFLEFSQLGFIGKVFRTRDLSMVAQFFLMFHRDKPIDWLLDHILWVKACNPEKDAKDCTNQKARLKLSYKPSLFQHVGLHSSLAGKVQPLKDKDFGKQSLFQPHPNNPTAQLDSTMTHYLQHSLERAYQGLDFYWALSPMRGDHLVVRFTQPAHVTGYVFRSGNIETHADRFLNTTLEVLPSNSSVRLQLDAGSTPRYAVTQDGFIVVGAFVNGVCEGHIEASLRPLAALRLKVHADSDVWALLSEIFIKV